MENKLQKKKNKSANVAMSESENEKIECACESVYYTTIQTSTMLSHWKN